MEWNGQKIDENYIKGLVSNKIPEARELEFKGKDYILKQDEKFGHEVAAMANAGGGLIVHGVATIRDPVQGVDVADQLNPFDLSIDKVNGKITLSQISVEDKLTSRIQPIVSDFEVEFIPTSTNSSQGYFVVRVAESHNIPHMFIGPNKGKESPSHKYFFRTTQGKNIPMDDYQVKIYMDSQKLSKVDVKINYSKINSDHLWIDFIIENIGSHPIEKTQLRIFHDHNEIGVDRTSSNPLGNWMSQKLHHNFFNAIIAPPVIFYSKNAHQIQRLFLRDHRKKEFAEGVRFLFEINGFDMEPYHGELSFTPVEGSRDLRIDHVMLTQEQFKKKTAPFF